MSGFWKKGYYILCFIVRTLYNLLSLGKKPKKPVKGRPLKNDAHWYGVSTFTNKEIIEFNMKFPNPHKKMAAGYVHCEGGPQETKDEHVCWWLYKDVDLSSFRIMEDKNE